MTRTLTILFGVLLITTPFLQVRFGGAIVPDSQLAMAWGGDSSKTTSTQRCDYQTDMGKTIYVGCTKVGGSCTQCGTLDANGTTVSTPQYSYIVGATTPTSPGQQYNYGQPKQNCGNIYQGTCVADTNNQSPTDFVCNGSLGPNACDQPSATGAQPPYRPLGEAIEHKAAV